MTARSACWSTRIGVVIEVEDETLESLPETLRGFAREVVSGVYKLSGRLLLALDMDKIVDLPDLNKLKGNREFSS